ncbi:aldo/keto reductase [Chondrinema litorale]|uniref:aldo/keto reductase n=1 Tax=Chondrinema litorale TaxID=2994555 RepID=UPI0025432CD9|nr:aldo/keto reductase [Chondrinema litorale]UZR98118.1 aldo/keto reductase [Chondrinema litorale]
MKYRKLVNTEEQLSAIGLGCMGMSFAYGPRDDKHSTETLEHALEIGLNFWDTADMYGIGHNEELVGKVVQKNRDKVFLATKFGFRVDDAFDPKDMKTYKTYFDSRPEYVKQACEASLKRLGIDTIDLYYSHRVDPNVPIEETVGAMAELVKEGKVRYLGLSEASPSSLRKANAVHQITALQSEYSLFTRDVEAEILPTCRELGITFIPYSPLGRGMLTGTIKEAPKGDDDFRRGLPRFQEEAFLENKKLVDKLEEIATKKSTTAAQLALAWLLAQGEDIIPIPGTKKIKYLDENAASVDIELSAQELKEITTLSDNIKVLGDRYSEGAMKLVNN